MSAPLQAFPILEFATGLYDYLKPWIRPQDAFEPLTNTYVYRGVLQKRNGSTIFGDQLSPVLPVMGIMVYQNESTGAQTLIVASTGYLYKYTAGATPDGGTLAKITGVSNSPFWFGTATSTLAVNCLWTHITHAAPGTVTLNATYGSGPTVDTVTDDGSGNFSSSGIFAAGGTINYTTGALSLNFTGTTVNVTLTISLTVSSSFPIFTGSIANFFNWTNWQPTSSITALSTSYLYMTNNKDAVTLFDGTNMARPGFYVDSASTSRITKALDVKVYNNRLLLLRPTLSTESNAANQDIYFSASFNPFNFIGDIAGNGGAISAATGDQIISARFLRDVLIIGFTNSTWSFQISGVNTPPFIFRRLNSTKTVRCPYGAIDYDERITNLGSNGFIACDGVNVQRFDINIIDYYETQIKQQYFNQDFSIRYDNLNQSWMQYPSNNADPVAFPLVGGVAPGSDQVLIYNFLENTWATYKNSFPMTCMGLFNVTSGTTWAELNVSPNNEWQETQFTWSSYGTQSTAPFLLAGDTSGNLYHLDNPDAVRDGESGSGPGTSFNVDILTTRWNPFISVGQKTQFAYIDVYYSVSSFDPLNPIQVTFDFYVDNSQVVAASRTLTFDGPSQYQEYTLGVGTGASSYSGTIISDGYIVPNTFVVQVTTSAGDEEFLDNGSGALIGSLGDSGTINYTSGAWTLVFAAKTVPTGNSILSNFQFINGNAYNWKRIYCNLIGEFIQIRIDPSEDAPLEILGFVLWARPAGRLTP